MAATGIEAGNNTRMPKEAELEARYPGWHVWKSLNRMCLATRSPAVPPNDDGTWAATLICNSWEELDAALTEQAGHDAGLALARDRARP